MNVSCHLCSKQFSSVRGLAAHISAHDFKTQEYYDLHMKKVDEGSCAKCGNPTDFRGMGRGYLKCCSAACSSNLESRRKQLAMSASGKKQTAETVSKRIKNTDQKKKQAQLEQTLMSRYGVANACFAPRSKQSKSRFVSGDFSGIFYRSSYELRFLQYCAENSISVESAETAEFCVPYMLNGKERNYYPDFYLSDFGVIIEIKPGDLLSDDMNQAKIHAGASTHSYVIVTEEELNNLDELFEYL